MMFYYLLPIVVFPNTGKHNKGTEEDRELPADELEDLSSNFPQSRQLNRLISDN